MPSTIARRRPPRFDLVGGSVVLDFVNTLDDRPSGQPKELLAHYVDLARFAEDTGVLEPYQVDRLIERSPLVPDAAQRALAAARELREAIYGVLAAIMDKRPVPATALTRLNGFVQEAAQHSELIESDGRFEWRFDDVEMSLESPLWPIARAAAELLASDELAYVRACASESCRWFFLDTSKNHRRRWCDMTQCGNRAKVRRFYARKRAER
jgi:predicted RNA-binding Zn ribbon-like protein